MHRDDFAFYFICVLEKCGAEEEEELSSTSDIPVRTCTFDNLKACGFFKCSEDKNQIVDYMLVLLKDK
jgi:hypothetical protein